MLNRLGPLPEHWQARFDELRARYGEPEQRPRGPQVWRGPQAPVSDADLASMTVEEIVEYLSTWQPGGEWDAPSPEGLGRVLREVVAADPQRFASEASRFTDSDATYVRALLGGLREAKRNGATFTWQAVLELCRATLDKPRSTAESAGLLDDVDPGWSWAWQESLHLIAEGLHDGEGRIPEENRELVWTVIEQLSEDPDPDADAMPGADGIGPATLALNSIRGAAIHAAFQYGWWLIGERPEDERQLPTELADLLDRHLDPEVEQSTAIRSIYGQRFPLLVACDAEFAAQHVGAIFPTDPALVHLWRAAWHAYIRFNRLWLSAFELLVEQYRRAIDEVNVTNTDDRLVGDAGEALVAHLMSLYWQGVIDFGDENGLLDDFYAHASVKRRAQGLDAIGHGLMDDHAPSEEGEDRLRALWERRLEAVRESDDPDASTELRGFAWWFASGYFDPVWSLAQLEAMLRAGGRVEVDHLVAQRLAALRSTQPLEVIRALELLVETGTREWFIFGAREEITAILTDGLAAGGKTESRARDLTNRLVARGHRDFERLLQR
jgi:hypothetical protein